MKMVVSLNQQTLTIYDGTRVVAQSQVSTGKKGHETPKGVFSIIQKRRYHRSNIYSGAPMPFMQRITWSGIALHLGRLPGYPASHGCVRLPAGIADQLFHATPMRTHVVIGDDPLVPEAFSHPNLPVPVGREPLLSGNPNESARSTGKAPLDEGAGRLMTVSLNVGRDGRRVNEATALTEARDGQRSEHHVLEQRRTTPLRLLITRRTRREDIAALQHHLKALGYDVGEVDGRVGPVTLAALRDFQTVNGLKRPGLTAKGLPDERTRNMLIERTKLQWPSAVSLSVRQDGRQIYTAPVELARAGQPVGTHLYTLTDAGNAGGASAWSAVTLQAKGRLPDWSRADWRKRSDEIAPMSAREAIARVRFPNHVRAYLEDRLTVGSSLILADQGSERETGETTDFVVLTD